MFLAQARCPFLHTDQRLSVWCAATLKVCWKVSSAASNAASRHGSTRPEVTLIFSRVHATICHYVNWLVSLSIGCSVGPSFHLKWDFPECISTVHCTYICLSWLMPRVPIHFHCPDPPHHTVALLGGNGFGCVFACFLIPSDGLDRDAGGELGHLLKMILRP